MPAVDFISGPADWAIAIHGGAGEISRTVSDEDRARYVQGLRVALECGESMLRSGSHALDVVEEVVRCLEDDESFNAGRGSVFAEEGKHELEASIMDGRGSRAGAVSLLETVRNPIKLARLVMEQTDHIFLSGDGAERFADEVGVERVSNSHFSTERRRAQLNRFLSAEVDSSAKEQGGSTVGCVVRDAHGHLAAATSTGGTTGKRQGRVGDSPILGAGNWADGRVAVSCTGKGEEFLRHLVAHEIAACIEYTGASIEQACNGVLSTKMAPGDGGVIAVGADGSVALVFNTTGMHRAAANANDQRCVAIWDEQIPAD